MPLNDQEIQRRKSRETLMNLGVDPYPPETFDVNVSITNILKNLKGDPMIIQI